jgi:predicted nucleic acid-binding protein
VRYLLDTNVLSEAARPAPDQRVVEWLRHHSVLDFAISGLVLGEIANGVALMAPGRRKEVLAEWLEQELRPRFRGRVLAVDEAVALAWGRLAAEGRHAGRELPVVDGLMLATAHVNDLTFVTRNAGDCGDRGVPVLDPWGD